MLDYVQGYFLEGPRADLFFLDQLPSLNGRRGKLKRVWRNIVGHEQRVVIAKITNPSWQAPLSEFPHFLLIRPQGLLMMVGFFF